MPVSLLTELRQRRIWRVLLAYPSVVFVLLQVVEFFINNYGLDHRILTACIVVSAVCLPAAFLWNWRHGEKGVQRFTRGELSAYAVSGIAAIVAAGWYWTITPAADSPQPQSTANVRSVAVMPFENAGNDADVQYLCDGIAESLTNWLATVPGVRVVAKSAAFRMRDVADDTAQLVEALGVDNVIRGRLERHGDEIVISAALIDTHDDSQLWGDRMVQPLAKVLDLERSIVAAIKDGLRLKVDATATAYSAAGGTDAPEAYQHYLRGHFLIQATDEDSIDLGLEDLRAAIGIDPKFALPYTDIASALLQKVSYGMANDESLRGEARNAAYTAVALAPELAEAHTALAMMHETITFDWAAAEEAFDAAIALAPRSPEPYDRYSEFLWATLRFDRALDMGRRALDIDPKDGAAMHTIGIAALYSGDFARAATALEQWNRFYPGSHWSYVKVALALSLDGRCNEAAIPAATAERLAQGRGSPLYESWLAWGYLACGRDDLYAVSKSRLEAFRRANPDSIDPGIGFYFLLEGDVDGVVDLVRKTIETRSPITLFIQLFALDYLKWQVGDRLARDPRMLEMIRQLEFPAH
jgi:TolB-like protein/tetratricopeptide (TPR) repeat protein